MPRLWVGPGRPDSVGLSGAGWLAGLGMSVGLGGSVSRSVVKVAGVVVNVEIKILESIVGRIRNTGWCQST